MVKKVVPFKSAYDVALEVAYKTLQQKVEHLVRYTNQCKRDNHRSALPSCTGFPSDRHIAKADNRAAIASSI